MTRAKITAQDGFSCAPQGHTVEHFPKGAEVEGRVAEWALEAHKAARMFDPRTDTQAGVKLETKRKRGRPRKETI